MTTISISSVPHHLWAFALLVIVSLGLSLGSVFVSPPKRQYGVRDIMTGAAILAGFAACMV